MLAAFAKQSSTRHSQQGCSGRKKTKRRSLLRNASAPTVRFGTEVENRTVRRKLGRLPTASLYRVTTRAGHPLSLRSTRNSGRGKARASEAVRDLPDEGARRVERLTAGRSVPRRSSGGLAAQLLRQWLWKARSDAHARFGSVANKTVFLMALLNNVAGSAPARRPFEYSDGLLGPRRAESSGLLL